MVLLHQAGQPGNSLRNEQDDGNDSQLDTHPRQRGLKDGAKRCFRHTALQYICLGFFILLRKTVVSGLSCLTIAPAIQRFSGSLTITAEQKDAISIKRTKPLCRIAPQRGHLCAKTAEKPYFKRFSGIEKVHRNSIKITVDFWWVFRDSNPGPTGYEPGALTN